MASTKTVNDLFPLTAVKFPLLFLKDGRIQQFANAYQITSLQKLVDSLSNLPVSEKLENFPKLCSMKVLDLKEFSDSVDEDNKKIIAKFSDLSDFEYVTHLFLLKTIAYLHNLKKVAQTDLSQYLFCSWCENVYDLKGNKVVDIPYELGESHGICDSCKTEMGKEVSQRKKLKGFEK